MELEMNCLKAYVHLRAEGDDLRTVLSFVLVVAGKPRVGPVGARRVYRFFQALKPSREHVGEW